MVFIPASGCNHPWRQNWYRRVATTIMDTLGVEVVFPLDGMPDPTGCREKVLGHGCSSLACIVATLI